MLRRALEASPKTLRLGAGGSEVGSEGGIECAMIPLMCSDGGKVRGSLNIEYSSVLGCRNS